jgi:SAM-dependent MidA family methyltransferase
LIEASPAARAAARKRLSRYPHIHLHASLDDLEHIAGVEGCVYSNEFFDALPVHRVVGRVGGVRELFVAEKDGALFEMEGDPSSPGLAEILARGGVTLAEGQKAEVNLRLGAVLEKIDEILARGFILTVDYGEPTRDIYRETRADGTLTALRKHQIMESPFQNMGECDITSRVDFGRLAREGLGLGWTPLIYVSQGTFLVNSAENFLKAEFERLKDSPDLTSLSKQAQHLMHPELLGGKFQVLVQAKNAGDPRLKGGLVNRLRRLELPAPEEDPCASRTSISS